MVRHDFGLELIPHGSPNHLQPRERFNAKEPKAVLYENSKRFKPYHCQLESPAATVLTAKNASQTSDNVSHVFQIHVTHEPFALTRVRKAQSPTKQSELWYHGQEAKVALAGSFTQTPMPYRYISRDLKEGSSSDSFLLPFPSRV